MGRREDGERKRKLTKGTARKGRKRNWGDQTHMKGRREGRKGRGKDEGEK